VGAESFLCISRLLTQKGGALFLRRDQPSSAAQFASACASFEIDIVTLDNTERLPFNLRPGVVKQAVDRGVFLEIRYGDAFDHNRGRCGDPDRQDGGISATATNVMSQATALARASKSKGLLMSSGATNPLAVRGPADVANLGTVFGMSGDSGVHATSSWAGAVLAHAVARKHGKGVIQAAPLREGEDNWKVPPTAAELAAGSAAAAPSSSGGASSFEHSEDVDRADAEQRKEKRKRTP
jgi:RNase P subunit p30